MVAINASQVVNRLQALKPTKQIKHNTAPFLLNLANIKANKSPIMASSSVYKQTPPGNYLVNNLADSPASKSLTRSVRQSINDFQLTSADAQTAQASNKLQAWASPFRLAEAVSKLYPRSSGDHLKNIARLVIFGDSLSDSRGRMFEKSHRILPSYGQYYDGRFTNGFVWGEYLSSPSFLKKDLINYAEGGSTSARYSPFNLYANTLSNLDSQMQDYQPSARDLTILFLGANDYLLLGENSVLKVIQKQIDDVERLLKLGVDNILVMGIPDLSLTPQSGQDDNKRKFSDISTAHNAVLLKNIEALKARYPAKKIFYFDTSSAFNHICRIADNIGYNTTESYTHHGYIHLPIEHNPALNISPEYLFNDGVHPTQEVHHAFATMLAHFISRHYSQNSQRAAGEK